MLLWPSESRTGWVSVLEGPRYVLVVALVLLRERDVPRRELPVQVQVMTPPWNDTAGAVDDRVHHAVDAAETPVDVLNEVLMNVSAVQAEREYAVRRRRKPVTAIDIQPPDLGLAKVEIALEDVGDLPGAAGTRGVR